MRYKNDNDPYNIWAETEILVEFYHCDPMRVVWHGNYINFFEAARRVLLEKIGYDYTQMEESGYAFPIIEVKAKYVSPLKFKDRAKVKAVLIEYENRLKMSFVIRNAETGKITTKGTSTQMAIDMKAGESCFVSPKILVDKIESMIRAQK